MKTACLVYLCTFLFCIFHNANTKKIVRKDVPTGNDIKSKFILSKTLHELKELSISASKKVGIRNDYESFHKDYLQNILRVRVPGTVGHHEVKMFIISKLKEFNWHVELDEFVEDTPLKKTKFTNIIATLNPNANRRLALAAHYDSKLLTPRNGKYFLGAVDSAVPCSMLLDFARVMAEKYKSQTMALYDVSPMIMFLDGEEAFINWTRYDSIYGSRHLAHNLSVTPHHNPILRENGVTMLDALDAFVLFDLIGADGTQFLNLFPSDTSSLYSALQVIEVKLRSNNVISRPAPYFVGSPRQPLFIEDDHMPFLRKGVPILHLISVPFPKQWHTLGDDESCLNPTIISDLLVIFRQFLLEYFRLDA